MLKKRFFNIFLSIILLLTSVMVLIPGDLVDAAVGTELYYDDGEWDAETAMGSAGGYYVVRFTPPPSTSVEITQLSFYAVSANSESPEGARVLIFNKDKVVIYAGDLFYNWNIGWNSIDLSAEDIPIIGGDFYAGFEMPGVDEPSFGVDMDNPIDQRSFVYWDRDPAGLAWPSTTEDYMIRATVVPAITEPDNDTFPGITISGESGSTSASNVDATVEIGEPSDDPYDAAHTVWWSWTAPQNGTVVIDTYGSIDIWSGVMDTFLAVYTGSSVGSLSLVAKNDDFDEYPNYQSQLAFKATQGTTYRIVADGYDSYTVGDIYLNWRYETAAVGDDFPGTAISGLNGQATGSNVFATKESDEPDHSISEYYAGQSSLWWSWTAPEDGRFLFDTVGSLFYENWGGDYLDTVMAIYTGDSLSELVLVGSDDFSFGMPIEIDFMATQGTIYHIVVDGMFSDYSSLGDVVLNWHQVTAPSITSADKVTFEVGTESSFTVTASGYPDPVITLEFSDLPYGVEFNIDTGTFSGTPEIGTGGVYPLTFVADNDIDPDDTQNFTLTVNESPSIVSPNNITFWEGTSGEFSVIANGYPEPEISLTGELPSGVTFNSETATFSGTPITGTGDTYQLILTAANGIISDATQNFTLTVKQPLTITSADKATFEVGTQSSFAVIATGYPEPVITLESGVLPSGVTFNSETSTFSGTPITGTGGNYPLTFRATNGIDTDYIQYFTLTVNESPSITSANNVTFKEGTYDSFPVRAAGYPEPEINITGDLPSGVTFDSETNQLCGIPEYGTGGSYPLIFTASNGVNPDATQNFILTIEEQMAPVITIQPKDTTVLAGETATFMVEYNSVPESMIQWQMSRDGKRWSNIAGANGENYTTPVAKLSMNGYQYRVLLNNGVGEIVISDAAILTVTSEPISTIADLSIDKQDGIYDPVTGSIKWEITVTNNGNDTAEGVVVKDVLAKGTKFADIDLSEIAGAAYKVKGSSLEINIGQLAVDTSVSFTITTTVSRATSPVGNTATVTTTSYDPDLSNNTDSGECSWE